MSGARPAATHDVRRLREYVHRGKRRYYAVWIQQDLFGTWCVMRAWGGSGTHLGRLVTTPMPDLARCVDRVVVEDRRRQEKGYFLLQQT